MRHHLFLSIPAFFLIPLLSLVLLAGCGDSASESRVSVQIEATPRTVVADGESTVQIAVTATEGGSPASGTVTLSTNRGNFAGSGSTLQETLSSGEATATLVTCDSREDEGCAGIAQVRADIGPRHGSVTVTFESAVEDPLCGPDEDMVPPESCEDVENCLGVSCGDHGLECDATGECTCPSGVENEAEASVPHGTYPCGDGIDHDCDGFADCRDPDCDEQPCADHGMICLDAECTCQYPFDSMQDVQEHLDEQDDLVGNERFACQDTIDWNCNGLIDCQDDDCEGMPCADHGMICQAGECKCEHGDWTNESIADVPAGTYACGDGIDHDCDGLVDCADPDCATQPCGDGMVCTDYECVPDPGLEQLTFWFEGNARVLASDDTEVSLRVELQSGDTPLADESVTFEVAGGLLEASGSTSHTTTTSTSGVAAVTWKPGTTPARDLEATVTVDETGTSKSVEIQVIGLSTITVQSVQYTTMGVLHSDYRENNLVVFNVRGTDGADANLQIPDGVHVEFSLGGSPAGGLELTNTDATTTAGLVNTTAVSGTAATTFSVNAVATLGGVTRSASTETISVIGARPSQQGFTLNCSRRNVPSFADHDGTNSNTNINVTCTARLQDRFGNPIERPTLVNFMAEGGNITTAAQTDSQGEATATFNTSGPLPVKVDPIDNEPYYEVPDPHDPSQVEIRNPRDGLITIMAYTTGEEEFVDLNGNGVWDQNEPFIDMSTPYLDINDTGTYTGIEPTVGDFEEPNGQWDSDTQIWTETKILATGPGVVTLDDGGNQHSGFHPVSSGIYLDYGEVASLTLRVADRNLNVPPEGYRTTLSVAFGDVSVEFGDGSSSFTYPDTGWSSTGNQPIRWDRRTVCADDTSIICSDCRCGTCPDNRCTRRSRIGPFNEEWYGWQHDVHIYNTRDEDDEDYEDGSGYTFRVDAHYDGSTPQTVWNASGATY